MGIWAAPVPWGKVLWNTHRGKKCKKSKGATQFSSELFLFQTFLDTLSFHIFFGLTWICPSPAVLSCNWATQHSVWEIVQHRPSVGQEQILMDPGYCMCIYYLLMLVVLAMESLKCSLSSYLWWLCPDKQGLGLMFICSLSKVLFDPSQLHELTQDTSMTESMKLVVLMFYFQYLNLNERELIGSNNPCQLTEKAEQEWWISVFHLNNLSSRL